MSTSSEWGAAAGVAVLMVAAGFVYMADTERLERHRPGAALWEDERGEYWNREYALDALALEYVGDYVDDSEIVRQISDGYWCWTPVVQQLGRLSVAEISEAALRARARELVIRAGVVPKDVPLDGGAEHMDALPPALRTERVTARQ